jgi:hypothetical protein
MNNKTDRKKIEDYVNSLTFDELLIECKKKSII